MRMNPELFDSLSRIVHAQGNFQSMRVTPEVFSCLFKEAFYNPSDQLKQALKKVVLRDDLYTNLSFAVMNELFNAIESAICADAGRIIPTLTPPLILRKQGGTSLSMTQSDWDKFDESVKTRFDDAIGFLKVKNPNIHIKDIVNFVDSHCFDGIRGVFHVGVTSSAQKRFCIGLSGETWKSVNRHLANNSVNTAHRIIANYMANDVEAARQFLIAYIKART